MPRVVTITPRMLTLTEAADYCGIAVSRFLVDCDVARVLMPRGDKRFDMKDLDAWLDGLKGLSLDDDSILAKLRKAS